MLNKRMGKQTIKLHKPPSIVSTGSIVGPKEGAGPLCSFFDVILDDDLFNEKSWERSESKLQSEAIKIALNKGEVSTADVNYLFAGDLLNQLMSSNYAARATAIPFFGLYGACSTMAESLSLGAMTVDGGFAQKVLCVTSSHFSSAERQFRYPLEFGNQRALTTQWTVTGSGAALLSVQDKPPYITHVTTGKIIDPGIKDVNNMGAAMAPAAADTIIQHFEDTKFSVNDYDLIITGDLGIIGKSIVLDLVQQEGYDIKNIYQDCGVKIFDNEKQDTHAGGSGCGCSAVVFCGYIYSKLKEGSLNRVLLVSTGALHSTTSIQQGESIPGIAHAVTISNT
ncbi:stage V sporulation protein AD [Abyssisolibacter fermentans]|uniref:stage V sporulation protein AD n=1 Tax=Abyssisolibacter fermentans TaxID=1766203 RepID=UPI000A718DFA|nr:stage V sporulation protein AD [Abyssisolibacter fermentans]